ncbi:sphingosine kinase [Geodermatophilus sp. Leaf369]|uniref:diacylglycerol kinase family protein n=1 Tax=Geodermatophilus sp. Leaf369 TaxID=1736354 RepID=UPI0006FF1DD6|nr:diacylglycerol kinase family protein [Geodermatophilus sp. Leaf369]KQS54647.1 sphingosine kinase [Geodermatophilus sp. Leaf369]
MRVALLVNAAAGRGRATAAHGPVRAALTAAGLEVHELAATDRTAAEAAVRAVAGSVAAVVVLGGDGAVHAAVQGLAGTGTALAVLPAGTGDDLALALGVPADPVAAARAAAADLLAGRSARVDLGRTSTPDGDRWWATVLCCGFDSLVSDRADRLTWPTGRRRYDVAIVAELARLRPRAVRLTLDGVAHELEVTLVAVGNTACYGGGLRMCPDADPRDGLLDVTVIGPVTRRDLVRTRPRLADGSHVAHPAVRTHRAAEVVLEPAGPTGEGLTAWADGEPVGPLPARTVVVPGALVVVGTGRR